MTQKAMVSYHDRDFDYLDWVKHCNDMYSIPNIQCEAIDEDESHQWQVFYTNHHSGLFYKPRRYISREFERYLPILYHNDPSERFEQSELCACFVLLEVGCGHGSSIFPLLQHLAPATKYIATDFSSHALNILTSHKLYDNSLICVRQWDITTPFYTSDYVADAVLCVFVLSAIDPINHIISIKNLSDILLPGGHILFRDYAEYDMTMFRHSKRLGDKLYRRNDGTLVFYFSIDYIMILASQCGLQVLECSYATVCVKNRSNGVSMNRVFIHAVLKKIC